MSGTTAAITAITIIAPANIEMEEKARRIVGGPFACKPMRSQFPFFAVAPLLAWMAFIFLMSTGVGGAVHTNSALDTFLAHYFPQWNRTLTWAQRDALHFYLRKTAHVTEYAVLGVLAVRALRGLRPLSAPRDLLRGAWVFATCYAATDEFHQIFVPGRTAKVTDVMLDSAGAAFGAGLMAWAAHRRRQRLHAPDDEASCMASRRMF